MLTIRKAQMQALSAYMRESFDNRMVRHIATAFPAEARRLRASAGPEDGVRALVRHGVTKAERYSIRVERDIASFIEFMVVLGPEFENASGMESVRRTLTNRELPGHAKVVAVGHLISRRPAAPPD